jgi:dTDP-glucose 4,6-dehydratase
MRILITGSLGTLGKPLVSELRKRGQIVIGCDTTHTEDPEYMRCDVRQYRQVQEVFELAAPELVYHLAAEFGRNNGEAYYEQLWSSNQIGTENIIRLCVAQKLKLVLAGSSEAYGDSGMPDCKEATLDDHVNTFHNVYALSKWVQERQVMIATKNRGLRAVTLRFFNAYGEGEYYSNYRSVVCLFCYRLMHGMPITVYRDYHRVFMHVDDWARTVANVADKFDTLPRASNFAGVPVYNIGGEEYMSVEEMAQIVLKELGYSSQESNGPTINYIDKEAANVTNKRPDLSLAKRDLGHRCTVSLNDGIRRTVKWMESVYGKTSIGSLALEERKPLPQVMAVSVGESPNGPK